VLGDVDRERVTPPAWSVGEDVKKRKKKRASLLLGGGRGKWVSEREAPTLFKNT
jgi:hypothetical protein